jgi:geranylgeranyl diphosphate synthase type I
MLRLASGLPEPPAYDPAMASAAAARDRIGLPPRLAEVGERAERRIIGLLDEELGRWRQIDVDLVEPLVALRELVVAGGKRLRPAFCYWAFVGAGGDPSDDVVVDVGAALELLHTFALVHDDIMDGSDQRRGRPAVHRRFINSHAETGGRGEARRFGEGAAILVGDFAFVYADQFFASAPEGARPIFDELRIELCVGQYLDLVGSASGSSDRARAERIERYKSGKYTVERPLHLGAALAGRLDELAAPLSAVGLPLGEAFQLRDDILGVFGDSSVTGKPVGDDLREGKLTPLVAAAVARASGPTGELLERLGSPDLSAEEIVALQHVLVETGARDEVERAIERSVDEALRALAAAPLTGEARAALEELGTFVAWRDR